MTPPLKLVEWELEADPPEGVEEPVEAVAAPVAPAAAPAPEQPPPGPEKIIEAMLFVGREPLQFEAVRTLVRGLTVELYQLILEEIRVKYRQQRRPYQLHVDDRGHFLAIDSAYRYLNEKILHGPKQVHLPQETVDVLSLIAWEQPVKLERIESIRGQNSKDQTKQLQRLGWITSTDDGFRTTPQFLKQFHLQSLDELPRLS